MGRTKVEEIQIYKYIYWYVIVYSDLYTRFNLVPSLLPVMQMSMEWFVQ